MSESKMVRKPRKKIQKTHEETTAENYFPVDETNISRAVEKKYQKPEAKDLEKIEILAISEKKGTRKKSSKTRERKTATKTSAKKGRILKEYAPPKINLKENGYELIITEKPQAALKIASALGTSVKNNLGGIPYYEVEREGEKIVVVCAVGHLFTLKQNSRGYEIPVFDISWVPNFIAKKGDFTKKYYDVILKLARSAGSVTVATDYDIEGEVIGFNVIRFICNQDDANRMKFSTLTDKELNEAYDFKSPTINWGQAIAGETRHYLDWFYGINLSRALMNAIKTTGKFKLMSIGRVQGPALDLIVKKEREIQAFKSKPYWNVFITIKNSHKIELKHNKDITKKSELEKFNGLVGKTAVAKTERKIQILPPNPPFDLTSLQTEAYKFFGITPSRTLQIAQSLYLSGLISYPRTSSQKLPDSIAYREILEKLARKYNVEKLITREKPVEGKKSDPAHPSIYPTGENQILSGEDEKIYNLILKRFLSLFCDDAIIDNKTVSVEINKLKFTAKGSSIRKKAWLEIYPVKMQEKEVPDVDGEVKIISSRFEEKETQPPRRYSPASIISELEKKNLGTKATRANILETLYDRGYIKEKSIEATPVGMSLIQTLEKNSPIIIDEELTRSFEKEMEKIQNAKKDFVQKEKIVIEKAKETIKKILEQFTKNENEIGKELMDANASFREQQKEENKLNICPLCKKGNLGIIYSRKTRRHFIACDKYPDCKNTYSLPPNGLIKPLTPRKVCEECGFPKLMRLSKGKRPWEFCFNPSCAVNKERLEEYRKRKEEENAQEKSKE